MKNLWLGLSATTGLVLGVSPANASDWKTFSADAKQNASFDRQSIKYAGSVINVWTRYSTLEGIKTKMEHLVINCKTSTVRPIETIDYDPQGKAMFENLETTTRFIIPDSYADLLAHLLCIK